MGIVEFVSRANRTSATKPFRQGMFGTSVDGAHCCLPIDFCVVDGCVGVWVVATTSLDVTG